MSLKSLSHFDLISLTHQFHEMLSQVKDLEKDLFYEIPQFVFYRGKLYTVVKTNDDIKYESSMDHPWLPSCAQHYLEKHLISNICQKGCTIEIQADPERELRPCGNCKKMTAYGRDVMCISCGKESLKGTKSCYKHGGNPTIYLENEQCPKCHSQVKTSSKEELLKQLAELTAKINAME